MINISVHNVCGQDGCGSGDNMGLPQSAQPALCPHLSNPFEECYCTSSSSMVVESTILFCGGNYRKCEIYANHSDNG